MKIFKYSKFCFAISLKSYNFFVRKSQKFEKSLARGIQIFFKGWNFEIKITKFYRIRDALFSITLTECVTGSLVGTAISGTNARWPNGAARDPNNEPLCSRNNAACCAAKSSTTDEVISGRWASADWKKRNVSLKFGPNFFIFSYRMWARSAIGWFILDNFRRVGSMLWAILALRIGTGIGCHWTAGFGWGCCHYGGNIKLFLFMYRTDSIL